MGSYWLVLVVFIEVKEFICQWYIKNNYRKYFWGDNEVGF